MTNSRVQAKKEKKSLKKKKKKHPVLKTFLVLLILAVIATGSYAFYLFKQGEKAANKAYDTSNTREKSALREEKVEPLKDNISILFVGIDDSEAREQGSDHSRSDALMLATLNNKDKSVKLLSIPRDSYVYIPYVGHEDKITHAHAYGGTQATIDTVENLLNVPVDYYYRLNFDAFIEIVDALGGIKVNVPYALHELDENDKRTVNLKPGKQLLNGREALALARTRHQDSDIKRGERQQMILEAIIKKASSVTSLTKYDDILAAVGNNMKTNMTFDEMKSLAAYIKGGMPKVDSLSLKGYDDMSTGVYYYKLDTNNLAEIKQTLQKHLGLTENDLNTQDNSTDDTETDTNTNTNTNNSSSNYNSSQQSSSYSGSGSTYSGSGSSSSYSSDYNSNN
ncbi:LytR family transcriptional regulator [Rummeliibacillus sp. TYF005]|uniref:LCP family protein n=1 Tax=Rummeliibacillus sp. TYF005 TaxID=2058214 RepID=UPI000F52A09A|nr:LCP family protein [Rummeliibacillus sp. TYF005]RPJ96805.1 LytR family transcriptional regulator [Rummeliibacillus sp. TYF005]